MSKILDLGILLACFKTNSVDFLGLATLLNWAKLEASQGCYFQKLEK